MFVCVCVCVVRLGRERYRSGLLTACRVISRAVWREVVGAGYSIGQRLFLSSTLAARWILDAMMPMLHLLLQLCLE